MTSRAQLRKYGLVAAMIVVIAVGGILAARYVAREVLPQTADRPHDN
jgi:hypothetical protein